MSKKLKEVRLNAKTGKITVKNIGSSSTTGVVMYNSTYSYIVVYETQVDKAKKSLYKKEMKKIEKILKEAEKKKKGLLKNKI